MNSYNNIHQGRHGLMPAGSEASQGKTKLPEPSDAMMTPDKKIQAPTSSTGSSARRILFNNLAHQDPEPAGQAAADGEEVQSKPRPLQHSCAVSSPVSSAAPQDIRAAARSLFGICPSSEKMGQYFQAAEMQVGPHKLAFWGTLGSLSCPYLRNIHSAHGTPVRVRAWCAADAASGLLL